MVDPGWLAGMDEHGNLILTRTEAPSQPLAAGKEADPVLLEVFNNLFMYVADQMGATLAKHRVECKHQGAARLFLRDL